MNRFLALTFICFAISLGYSQDTLSIDDIYFHDDIAYKVSNDQRFTGISQRVRQNGHVVFESHYDDGIIQEGILYYNLRDKDLAERIIYYQDKVYVPQKKIKYTNNKHGEWQLATFYNKDGEKVLEKHINAGKLNYRCEFLNGKKHGTELCHDDEGNKLIFHYQNGKKIK